MPSHMSRTWMSRGGRRASAATALVAVPVLVGAVAVVPAAAAAAAPEPARVVTFTGGCGLFGVGARSAPDVRALTVPAGSELEVANQLGRPASLWLDGERSAEVPAGERAPVTVPTSGPVTVSMRLDCAVGSSTGQVTVDVAGGDDPPSPPEGDAGDPDGDPADGDDPGAAESGRSGSAAGAEEPGTARPGRPGEWSAPDQDSAGSAPPSSPAVPEGAPPDEPETPGAEAETGTGPVATATVDPPSATRSAELTRVAQAGRDGAAHRLLGLIAAVCLVGVSAGAVRVLVSRRSNPVNWA